MELNEYQSLAKRTMNKSLPARETLLHALHGLASEVGEIHALYQKTYQGHKLDLEKVFDEMGDVLWFLCEMCTVYGIDMETIAQHNIEKLKRRYPEGFDPERSIHRSDPLA